MWLGAKPEKILISHNLQNPQNLVLFEGEPTELKGLARYSTNRWVLVRPPAIPNVSPTFHLRKPP
jgi:hypothetical protein